jgi:methyl-accepting chemotaxis protein
MVVVSAAVTSMVAIAFLVPLFFLVSDLAYDRAVNRAERDAEAIARVLAVLVPSIGIDAAVVDFAEQLSLGETSILVGEETLLGPTPVDDEDWTLALGGTAFRDEVAGGVVIYVPVPRTEGPGVVVRSFVDAETLSLGVTSSWLTLGGLGLGLTVLAVFFADRLGRSVVRAVRSLSSSTVALGEGDHSARVRPDGPDEVREVGNQIKRLAERKTMLLQRERENAADH